MSLNDIINEFDKDQSVTAEQLAGTLLNKDNLSLKTEIPFDKEVWATALRKDVCYLAGDMVDNLKILQRSTDGKIALGKPTYKITTAEGKEDSISFGEKTTIQLLRQIGFSEEYAVSHRRKGRTEMTSVLGKKMEIATQKKQDSLSSVMGK